MNEANTRQVLAVTAFKLVPTVLVTGRSVTDQIYEHAIWPWRAPYVTLLLYDVAASLPHALTNDGYVAFAPGAGRTLFGYCASSSGHKGIRSRSPVVEAPAKSEPPCTTAELFLKQLELRNKDSDNLVLSAEPRVWDEIKEKFGDGQNFRLEYLEPHIIVTWPTGVHESFTALLAPFAALQRHDPMLLCRYNESIRASFLDKDGTSIRKSDRIPDFVLIRKQLGQSTDKPLIMLECAASQTEPALSAKAQMWLENTPVELVITLDLKMAQYHSPASRPSGRKLTWDEFIAEANISPLGPVTFQGVTLAHEITSIEATLYKRGTQADTFSTKSINVTPNLNSVDLLPNQNQVNLLVALATRRAVGPEAFDVCFDEEKFYLDWPSLYQLIEDCVKKDSFRRYEDLFAYPKPNPLKRVMETLDDADEAEMEALKKRVCVCDSIGPALAGGVAERRGYPDEAARQVGSSDNARAERTRAVVRSLLRLGRDGRMIAVAVAGVLEPTLEKVEVLHLGARITSCASEPVLEYEVQVLDLGAEHGCVGVEANGGVHMRGAGAGAPFVDFLRRGVSNSRWYGVENFKSKGIDPRLRPTTTPTSTSHAMENDAGANMRETSKNDPDQVTPARIAA
ncbi:hypothetical protein DFH06DRAFT_1144162 [Mycena polygramma]|nr:hypothetical protein DFH06DRAFT_1144162 [Mycena polygramma]